MSVHLHVYICLCVCVQSSAETVSFALPAPPKPTVTLQPSWTQIYRGETVTVRCEIQGGEGAQWTYGWRRGQLKLNETSREYRISRATESDGGGYRCRCRRSSSWTEWSDFTALTVSCKLNIFLSFILIYIGGPFIWIHRNKMGMVGDIKVLFVAH
uniref:Ig-like domain-containing protein n=1 Tax=Oreochromis aureus TaxID=47969 RepID=A0A668RUW5_OREAU